MLDYGIIAAKPLINIPGSSDGSTSTVCKDLFANSISGTAKLKNYTFITVTDDYIARPDLISQAVYGTDEFADVICKINGVSNPFELNTGMILIIPTFQNILSFYKRSNKSATIDDSKFISLTSKNNQKAKNASRNPNEQIIGDNLFVIDKQNKVVLY